MIAKATAACPAADRRSVPARPRRVARCTSAHRAIIGSSSTAENLATHARPNTTALSAKGPQPGVFRWRHHAAIAASMKNAMHTSDVA